MGWTLCEYNFYLDYLARDTSSWKDTCNFYSSTKLSWDTIFHYGYEDQNLFIRLMDQIKEKVRIVLIIGPIDSHLGLVEAIEDLGKCKKAKSKVNEFHFHEKFVSEHKKTSMTNSFFVVGISAQLEYDKTGKNPPGFKNFKKQKICKLIYLQTHQSICMDGYKTTRVSLQTNSSGVSSKIV